MEASPRICRALSGLTLVAGGAVAGLAALTPAVDAIDHAIGAYRVPFGATGLALAVGGLLAIRRARLQLALMGLAWGLLISVAACSWLRISLSQPIYQAIGQVAEREDVTRMVREDPRYGYRPRPNMTVTHEDLDFVITYRTGPEGRRLMPKPSRSAGRLVAVGGSFTFGEGVADDETYAYHLARGLPGYTVENRGVSGWGPVQVYLTVEDLLREPTPPKLILYGFISHHVIRIDEFFGRWKDSPADPLRQWYERLPKTAGWKADFLIRILQRIQQMCRRRGVEFVVLLLAADTHHFPQATSRVRQALTGLDIPHIDGLSIGRPRDYHRFNQHPKPGWHRQVAELLLGSKTLRSRLR